MCTISYNKNNNMFLTTTFYSKICSGNSGHNHFNRTHLGMNYLNCLYADSKSTTKDFNIYVIEQNNFIWDNTSTSKPSNITRTLVGNKIVDHSDIVGAVPVQLHLHLWLNTWLQWIGQTQLQDEKRNFWDLVRLILGGWQYVSNTYSTQ